jgi:flagellar basal-body rod protein FlgB
MSDYLFNPLYKGLENVLDLRAKQHALTAGNLANADTPGYHARFISFEEVLGAAVDRPTQLGLKQTHAAHMPASTAEVNDPDIEEIEPPPWSEDQNSVVAEQENIRMAENATLYKGVMRGVSRKLAILRFAANDGKF